MNLKVALFESARLVPEHHWEAVRKNRNFYLSLNFLEALEARMDGEMEFRYLIFHDDQATPVAIAYLQLFELENFNESYKSILSSLGMKSIPSWLSKKLSLKVRLCGNAFLCGEHGFIYDKSLCSEDCFEQLAKSFAKFLDEDQNGDKASLLGMKEFSEPSVPLADSLLQWGYQGLYIDVNMVLDVWEQWQSFDDYLACMNTKFRTKAKSVLKKSAEVQLRQLNAEEIEQFTPNIQALYEAVIDGADNAFVSLNMSVYQDWKWMLGDKFVVNGYFINGEMIGFSAAFKNERILDAHYVGFLQETNLKYSLYQRMLYDYVRDAIAFGAESLWLGRTAERIKSGIGAEPKDMKLYVKHRNSLTNRVMQPIVNGIKPTEFRLEKPFKAEYYT